MDKVVCPRPLVQNRNLRQCLFLISAVEIGIKYVIFSVHVEIQSVTVDDLNL